MAADTGLVFGLDIGTTKVCAIVGEYNKKEQLEITGVGLSPSTGIKKGVIVNMEDTIQSIRKAVEAAEMIIGQDLKAKYCWPGIGGNLVEGRNSRGVASVKHNKDKSIREVTQADIDRALLSAQTVAFPMDREILEVIPQSFILDGQKGIPDPLNMIGLRLEAEVHIITCSITSKQNLKKCINEAGFLINDMILQSLAASRAVLTPEEKDMGVVLIDLGGGTTDMLVYIEGTPYLNASIPAGSTLITSDISKVMSIPPDAAEKIKVEAGCCWEDMLDSDEDILVPGVGGRPPFAIPRSEILAVIQPRMEETLYMVKEKLDAITRSKMEGGAEVTLGAGIVLTGGGALLAGAAELASYIFKMPVRIGNPLHIPGLVGEYRSPIFSTAIGLLLLGGERSLPEKVQESRPHSREKPPKSENSIFKRFYDWLSNDFF